MKRSYFDLEFSINCLFLLNEQWLTSYCSSEWLYNRNGFQSAPGFRQQALKIDLIPWTVVIDTGIFNYVSVTGWLEKFEILGFQRKLRNRFEILWLFAARLRTFGSLSKYLGSCELIIVWLRNLGSWKRMDGRQEVLSAIPFIKYLIQSKDLFHLLIVHISVTYSTLVL